MAIDLNPAEERARMTTERFKEAATRDSLFSGDRSHVLMLMIGSDDAAGWNGQVANHVLLYRAWHPTPSKTKASPSRQLFIAGKYGKRAHLLESLLTTQAATRWFSPKA
jgi:hypothetical protein